MKEKRKWNDPYVPGDYIEGVGLVDTIHAGLPWVPAVNGDLVFGAIPVLIGEQTILCDALDGHVLMPEEIEARVGDLSFNYANRFSNGKEPKPRPKRELEAINQSIVDRQGFVNRVPYTKWRKFFKNLKFKMLGR